MWFKHHWAITCIVLLAALITIPKLSKPLFWQDEAETALLARSILSDGIPKAWDGTNLVTQLSGNDSNSEYVWSFTPWLPFYIVAASFKVLGETNFAGRIPYVLIGIMGLLTLYLFTYRWSHRRGLAVLSSAVLLLNMQFILYSRQCKYYSLFFLIPPLIYLAYLKIHERAGQFILFVLLIVMLFYTNYVTLFTALFGLILYTFIARRERKHIYAFIAAGLVSLLLAAPFFLLADFGVSASLISRLPSLAEYFEKLARHIWYFNNMVFGLVLFIPLIIFYKKRYFSEKEAGLIRFLLWIIIPAWLVLPLFNQDVFRYNLHLIPLFSVLSALLVIAFFRWSKAAGAIFVILFVVTNIFWGFPGIGAQVGFKASGISFEDKTEWAVKNFNKDEYKTRKFFQKMDRELDELTLKKILTHSVLKAEYAAYFNELTTDYPDAIAAVADYMGRNAKDGDIVYGNFDCLPLMFYLPGLKFAYQVDPSRLVVPKSLPLPEYVTSLKGVGWYFFRDVKMNMGPYLTDDEFLQDVRKQGKRLIPHDLGISSLYWDINWPQRFGPYINKMLWHDTRGYENVMISAVK